MTTVTDRIETLRLKAREAFISARETARALEVEYANGNDDETRMAILDRKDDEARQRAFAIIDDLAQIAREEAQRG